EQISYLYSLPPERMKATLSKALDELSAENILLAKDFAKAVLGYSNSDQALANFFNVVDIASVLPVATASKALRGMSRASKVVTSHPSQTAELAAAAGLPKETAVARILEAVGAGDPGSIIAPSTFKQV